MSTGFWGYLDPTRSHAYPGGGRRRSFPRSAGTAILLASLAACQPSPPTGQSPPPAPSRAASGEELLFVYGSEKEKWITELTEEFNRSGRKTSSGKPFHVRAVAMGSGEGIDAILSGELKAHLVSPASEAFITLGNAQSRAKVGKPLVGTTESLVVSPVVLAMWKPMAEAMGWGKKPIAWADILALAKNPKGWQAYGYPQWGQFKFGHTHPEFSNSGLIALIAEVYAAVGKTRDLRAEDVSKPATGDFLAGIEQAVVHYGSSTGFFGRKMFASGPQYLSAAVLYESMVVESYAEKNLPFPLVSVYPKEGTFWSDHPVGIVEREWVTPELQDAAKAYIHYLLEKPQQEKALSYGFRPASVDAPIGAPIDAAHGCDPAEPKTTLAVPSADVIDGILKLWQVRKKRAEVALVVDTSGSMNEEHKLPNAREGAKQFVSLLADEDEFSLLPFSTTPEWASQDLKLKDGRTRTLSLLDSLFAQGNTALYDAIDMAYQHLLERKEGTRIRAVVVLTDGEDTNSRTHLPDLLTRIRYDGESHTVHVFTIAYGQDARKDILKQIADATQAKSYEGTPKNIRDVFKDISTFF